MTTPTAWAHLPNAAHIDAVLADVKARPGVWNAAYGKALQMVPEPIGKALDARGAAASVTSRTQIMYVENGIMMTLSLNGAWVPASDAMDALVAWDSSADLLDLSPDALRVLVDVAAPPVCHQAALLLPWAIVKHTEEVTPV